MLPKTGSIFFVEKFLKKFFKKLFHFCLEYVMIRRVFYGKGLLCKKSMRTEN